MSTKSIITASIKSAGIFLGLLALGGAILLSRQQENYVTVKGLATRDVKANMAVLEIDYREVGANLITLSKKVADDQTQVVTFLKSKGFTDDEIQITAPKVNDAFANNYSAANTTNASHRYTVTGGIVLHSSKVDLVRDVNQSTQTLLAKGIPLAFDNPSVYPNPSYFYTSLDSIRPQMLADATQSARLVATQFAKDSSTTLGRIRNANQGQFQILSGDSDEAGNSQQQLSAINKKIRLVTTVQYYLS